MKKNELKPLKNKKWLFPETGKAGFHYDDVSSAVEGLRRDLQQNYSGLHERELISEVEKWFPDVTEREQALDETTKSTQKTVSMYEEELPEIVEYGLK